MDEQQGLQLYRMETDIQDEAVQETALYIELMERMEEGRTIDHDLKAPFPTKRPRYSRPEDAEYEYVDKKEMKVMEWTINERIVAHLPSKLPPEHANDKEGKIIDMMKMNEFEKIVNQRLLAHSPPKSPQRYAVYQEDECVDKKKMRELEFIANKKQVPHSSIKSPIHYVDDKKDEYLDMEETKSLEWLAKQRRTPQSPLSPQYISDEENEIIDILNDSGYKQAILQQELSMFKAEKEKATRQELIKELAAREPEESLEVQRRAAEQRNLIRVHGAIEGLGGEMNVPDIDEIDSDTSSDYDQDLNTSSIIGI